jgi:hypothetical protein
MAKTLTDRLLEAMAAPPKLLFGTLHYADRCGAKTRSGGRCQNAPMQLGGRCRMHGGASLRGLDHPRYKHGQYTKYKPIDIDELLARLRSAPPPDFSWLEPNPPEGLDLDVDLSDLLGGFGPL